MSRCKTSEDELIKIVKEAKESPLLKKYVDVLRTYREFKELRQILGKPIVTEIDIKKIKEDLSGAEFISQLEKEKKARRK